MIRPRYAFQLARTKLRSKRGVLAASIVVSSILFAALIAAVVVFTGIQKSAVRFVEAANDDQYLVSVTPKIPISVQSFYDEGSNNLSLETIRSIKAYEKKYYEAEKAKYAAAKIEYNAASEIKSLKPSSFADPMLPEEQRVLVEWTSPVISELLDQKLADYLKTATNKTEDILKIGTKYNAKDYYAQSYSELRGLPALRLVQNGKENFTDDLKYENTLLTADRNTIHNGTYGFSDDTLLQRHLFKTDSTGLKGIPVVPSAQEVAKLFGKERGIPAEPEQESEKPAWLKMVQEKSKGLTYQACYRNNAEVALLEKIQRDYIEMKASQGTEGYTKPTLQYKTPDQACGDITVASDTRTASEKNTDKALEADQKKLGTYVASKHQLLTFEVVGLVYAQPLTYSTTNVNDFINGLLSGNGYMNSNNSMASIPTQMYNSLPDSLKFDSLVDTQSGRLISPLQAKFDPRIVAFATIDEARRFVNEVGCRSSDGNCKELFYTDTYGSNYLLLDQIGKSFVKIMTVVLPIVVALASIIIWFTISRIMAENRRETAVYRAMGAKRSDILAIYGLYTVLVASRIAVISTALGILAAFVIDKIYAPSIESTAASMFGIIKNAPQFSMFDVSSPLLLGIIASIFIVSIIASIQPLIRNVLRHPVKDMRNE
jgi:hypothetical protein